MTSRSSPLVLVVDADPVELSATAAILHGSRCNVFCAEDLAAALEAGRELNLDLVLSDVDVNGVPGTEVVSAIRQYPRRAFTPAIFSSSVQLPEVIRRADDGGAVYQVRKPFDAEILLELIEQTLSQSSARLMRVRNPFFAGSPFGPFSIWGDFETCDIASQPDPLNSSLVDALTFRSQ